MEFLRQVDPTGSLGSNTMQIVETAEPSFEICKIVDLKSCFSKNTVLNLLFSNFKELIKVAGNYIKLTIFKLKNREFTFFVLAI
jgi:hypothetical protein